jgi:penicillin amidase
MVIDLSDPDKVAAVLPGGVAGRTFHRHFNDQVSPFMNGEKLFWWFSDAAIAEHAASTLVLRPGVRRH